MFGLVSVSDGQNEGPLNNGSDIYCSACSPLVWDNLGLFHMLLTVENPSSPSIRLVWQVSRIGAPFTEKKSEAKIAAVNAGCRNKMEVCQRKISRMQLSSALRQQENRYLKKKIDDTLDFSAYFTCV